jgi:hypothetical protein
MRSLLLVSLLFVFPVLAQELATKPAIREKVLEAAKPLPVFFTVPETAMLPVPAAARTRFIDYTHPRSAQARVKTGLRFLPVNRARVQQQLAGLVQDGDLILTFRPEWVGGGAYPHVQMGVTHAGVIYKDGGQIKNVDAPMNDEYVGALNSPNYQKTDMLHVIRPRGVTATQVANMQAWSKIFADNRTQYYMTKVTFNSDYGQPKYKSGAAEPYAFVKTLANHALGQPAPNVSVYCSEFAWAIHALRNCSPVVDAAAFTRPGMPSCVEPLMEPLKALGDFAQTNRATDAAGLGEGPLLLFLAMDLDDDTTLALISEVFTATGTSRMSGGHRAVADQMAPHFTPLKTYYLGLNSGSPQVAGLKDAFNTNMKANYSPTAFVVNTFLPRDNETRAFDYLGTIMFVD